MEKPRLYLERNVLKNLQNEKVKLRGQMQEMSENYGLYIEGYVSIGENLRDLEATIGVRTDNYNATVAERAQKMAEKRAGQLEKMSELVNSGQIPTEVYQNEKVRFSQTLRVIETHFPGTFYQKEFISDSESSKERDEVLRQAQEILVNMIPNMLIGKSNYTDVAFNEKRDYFVKQEGEDSLYSLFPEDMTGKNMALPIRILNTFHRGSRDTFFGVKALLDNTDLEILKFRNIGEKSMRLIQQMREVARARDQKMKD